MRMEAIQRTMYQKGIRNQFKVSDRQYMKCKISVSFGHTFLHNFGINSGRLRKYTDKIKQM